MKRAPRICEQGVTVDGRPKGVVYRRYGYWHWVRGAAGGVETYARSATLADVKAHIARVCRAETVTFGDAPPCNIS